MAGNNLCVVGCGGRMGQAILKNASEFGFENILGVGRFDNFESAFLKADVIIDFSSPDVSLNLFKMAALHPQKFVVCGTTGFEVDLNSLPKNVIWSSNTSVGVNLLFDMVKIVATALPQAECEILERHHNKKKDSPSGTAISLAKKVLDGRCGNGFISTDRNHIREIGEIGIASMRHFNTVGWHCVEFWCDDGVVLKIGHNAKSRDIFAIGALEIARRRSYHQHINADVSSIKNAFHCFEFFAKLLEMDKKTDTFAVKDFGLDEIWVSVEK